MIFSSVFYLSFTEKVSENYSSEFLIKQTDIKPYNPHNLEKYYLPIPDKKGFILNLSDIVHDKYFEIVINPNNRFDIEFRKDDLLVGNLQISGKEP